MSNQLKPAVAPAYLRMGLFGRTGAGKSYTAAKVMSQFVRDYLPESQVAMFDTEGGAGYLREMVRQISGKELLVMTGQTFSELMDFADEVVKNGYVAIVDSVTHPWQALCEDYLTAKRSRVQAAGGRTDTVRLTLQDWGPIKEVWGRFSSRVRYDPVHWCLCGRESDVWEDLEDEEGQLRATITGQRMKTERDMGYEPSILVRLVLRHGRHVAIVEKERFDVMCGATCEDPDIEFFRPHIDLLNLGGEVAKPQPAEPAFRQEKGPNWETIKARRAGILENIKDDLVVAIPGQSAAEKRKKIELLRSAFGTSSWTELESDHKKFPASKLRAGRKRLAALLAEARSSKEQSDAANH